MKGRPEFSAWLPEGKEMSHGWARVWAPLSGKGKGREERKPEVLETHKVCVWGGALIFPDLLWLALPAPTLVKSFSQHCPPEGHPQAGTGLHQEFVQAVSWCVAWGRGCNVTGQKGQRKTDLGFGPSATSG